MGSSAAGDTALRRAERGDARHATLRAVKRCLQKVDKPVGRPVRSGARTSVKQMQASQLLPSTRGPGFGTRGGHVVLSSAMKRTRTVARSSEISTRNTNGGSRGSWSAKLPLTVEPSGVVWLLWAPWLRTPPTAEDAAPASAAAQSLRAISPRSCKPKADDHRPRAPLSLTRQMLIIGCAENEVPLRWGQFQAQRCHRCEVSPRHVGTVRCRRPVIRANPALIT